VPVRAAARIRHQPAPILRRGPRADLPAIRLAASLAGLSIATARSSRSPPHSASPRFLLVALLQRPAALFGQHSGPGAFYAVIPLPAMLTVAGLLFIYALLAMFHVDGNFWRDIGAGAPRPRPLLHALHDAFTLRNLGGGGDGATIPTKDFHTRGAGCTTPCSTASSVFVAPRSAAIDHNLLGWVAPYALLSAPVGFGTIGGVLMVIGTAGLIRLKSSPIPRRRLVRCWAANMRCSPCCCW